MYTSSETPQQRWPPSRKLYCAAKKTSTATWNRVAASQMRPSRRSCTDGEYTEHGILLPDSIRKPRIDRKSTRLNSSHVEISYAVFCLKKKKNINKKNRRKILQVDNCMP